MIRLTSGEFRGRAIATPKDTQTRPTQAKLRQALFNSLQTRITGARVLDLFAGSGALGFEALSLGADLVVFAESARPVQKIIQQNARELGVSDRARVLIEGLPGAWKSIVELGPFDIVLADPPYAEGWEMRLLEESPWSELLSPDGVFCLEWGALKSRVAELPEAIGILEKIREKHYGDSVLSTYRKL